jgi:iron complex transport system substrate-binding protein
METVSYSYPLIRDLPAVGGGPAKMNYEMIAGLDPDLVILRVGGCSFSSMEDEGVQKRIKTIEALEIPVVVLKNHRCFDKPDISTISDEYPIDVMVIAKAAYPDRFEDIDLDDWLVEFFKNVYDVDDETAKALISTQWMDWCVEK